MAPGAGEKAQTDQGPREAPSGLVACRQAGSVLQQNENTLRTILECIQAGIVVIDPTTHTIVSVNRAGVEMIGLPAEEIVGKVCHRHICPAEEGRCPVTDCGQTVDNSERVLLTAGGVRVPIIKTVAPLLLDSEQLLVESFFNISKRKEIEEALAAEKEDLALLNQAAVEMSQCLTTLEVRRVGIRLACKTTGAGAGILCLLPSETRSRAVGSKGLDRDSRRRLHKILRTSAAVSRVLDERVPVLLSAVELAGGTASNETAAFTSGLLAPIMSRGKSIGVLCLATEPGQAELGASDCALAAGVGALIGVAWENARLYEDARYLAERDPVTGLLNHRGITTELDRELSRSGRLGGQFAVAIMDLDKFKLFNDTYGHVVGDEVLQIVAAILKKCVRRSDVVGRYGGDEFVTLLPDTEAGSAVSTVERIRNSLNAAGYVTADGSRVPVHMSYGMAVYPFDGRNANELLAAADANLYRAKRDGGDCIAAPGTHADPQAALPQSPRRVRPSPVLPEPVAPLSSS